MVLIVVVIIIKNGFYEFAFVIYSLEEQTIAQFDCSLH